MAAPSAQQSPNFIGMNPQVVHQGNLMMLAHQQHVGMGISSAQLTDMNHPGTAYTNKEMKDNRQSSKPKFIQSEAKTVSQKLWQGSKKQKRKRLLQSEPGQGLPNIGLGE